MPNRPMQVAADLAAQLRADPIAASQIHEHIPATELLDLLNLRAAMAEHVEEMVEHIEEMVEQMLHDKNDEIGGLEPEIAELTEKLSYALRAAPPQQRTWWTQRR